MFFERKKEVEEVSNDFEKKWSREIQEFRDELKKDPKGLQPTNAMEALVDRVTAALSGSEAENLKAGIKTMHVLGHTLFGQSDNTPKNWLAWYGGQARALSSIMRTSLEQNLPLRFEHLLDNARAANILTILDGASRCNCSELMVALGLSAEPIADEMVVLVRDELVSVTVSSRDPEEKWFRITGLGRAVKVFLLNTVMLVDTDTRVSSPAEDAHSATEEQDYRGFKILLYNNSGFDWSKLWKYIQAFGDEPFRTLLHVFQYKIDREFVTQLFRVEGSFHINAAKTYLFSRKNELFEADFGPLVKIERDDLGQFSIDLLEEAVERGYTLIS